MARLGSPMRRSSAGVARQAGRYEPRYPSALRVRKLRMPSWGSAPESRYHSAQAVTAPTAATMAGAGVWKRECARPAAAGAMRSRPMVNSTRTSALIEATVQAKNDAATPRSRTAPRNPESPRMSRSVTGVELEAVPGGAAARATACAVTAIR